MSAADQSGGPLHGLRVLELGSFIAGPFAGQLLGDYGAEVVKVEGPDGDPMRRWGVTHEGEGTWWPSIARNKRSVVADLRTPAGRELLLHIAAQADVVLENFRPGRLAEFGLDYESLRARNPGVVLVHVSGFG
jgi:crotonobetainyl-CoA:carnitine CoA-transferase CaiB-like acyl-CoA transferase